MSVLGTKEKEKLKEKHNSSSETLHDVGQADNVSGTSLNKPADSGPLSTRFAILEVNSESKHSFKSPFSSSDSAIHNQVSEAGFKFQLGVGDFFRHFFE